MNAAAVTEKKHLAKTVSFLRSMNEWMINEWAKEAAKPRPLIKCKWREGKWKKRQHCQNFVVTSSAVSCFCLKWMILRWNWKITEKIIKQLLPMALLEHLGQIKWQGISPEIRIYHPASLRGLSIWVKLLQEKLVWILRHTHTGQVISGHGFDSRAWLIQFSSIKSQD